MQDLNNNPPSPDDNSPALADLLTPADAPAELLEVIEAPAVEKPKRKQKRRFYFPNGGLYASVAGVAAITTLIVVGIVLLIIMPRFAQSQSTPTYIYPTPIPAYDPYRWDWNSPLMTTDYVGAIIPNSLVYITDMNFDPTQQVWLYTIRDANQTTASAYEWQITPPLPPTPTTFPFAQAIGMGYLLITTEQVGAIPPNTRVRIGTATTDSEGLLYTIETETNQITAEARPYQLTYAPDVTPGVTPTSPFMGASNPGEFNIMTLVQVGTIPPNTRVTVGSAFFNGHEWQYSIVTQDGAYADNVLGSQLTLASPLPPTETPVP